MKEKYFYIEFEIINLDRFKAFQLMFAKLKEVKNDWMQDAFYDSESSNLDYHNPIEDFDWHSYLDGDAIAYFKDTFDYKSEEGKIYHQLWQLTTPKIRLNHPFFKTPGNWNFESTIDSIFSKDYVLVDLVREENNQGCLYYDPHGFPFGGSDSLVELIRAFGNKVIYDSWHENDNPIIQSQWDYQLAKKLVTKNIGFTP